jgi:hypothetical protein
MIDFISDLVRTSPDHPMRSNVRGVRVHRITPDPSATQFRDGSGFRTDRRFILRLFDLGRQTGRAWLERALPNTVAHLRHTEGETTRA